MKIKETKSQFLALFVIFFLSLCLNSTAQENSERKNLFRFADKNIHSFGFQYNNTFHAKGKFEYRNAPDYSLGDHPCISYGREYIVKYNLTYPSGWGITAEFVAGNRDFMTWRRNTETGKKMYAQSLWNHSLKPFIDYTYFGGQIKASYMYRLNDQITMQPEVGIKLLKYLPRAWGSIQAEIIDVDEFGRPIFGDAWRWRDLSNDDLYEKFVPELTAGINFLFHSKKDPRHSFVLGLNGTLGFIDRYTGWQRFTPTEVIDVTMRYGSSFFALNMGYEFTGFKKPLHKTKKYKKEIMQFETFDFSKPIHSVGFYFTSGFSFNNHMKETQGEFRPISGSGFVPEFNFRYSLSVKNGLGFAVEIPFGLFLRPTYYSLLSLIPTDSVWAGGNAVGPGYPITVTAMIPYVGLALKFSYLAQIHRNMFIQPEIGIKFMPFMFPSSSIAQEGPEAESIYFENFEGFSETIVWLHDCPTVPQNYYAVPDITLAVNFMVRGKKPHHNFIFGINANIGFVDRWSWEYHTTEVIPKPLQSSGKYGWKSSYLGFHVGYQFMTACKKKKL